MLKKKNGYYIVHEFACSVDFLCNTLNTIPTQEVVIREESISVISKAIHGENEELSMVVLKDGTKFFCSERFEEFEKTFYWFIKFQQCIDRDKLADVLVNRFRIKYMKKWPWNEYTEIFIDNDISMVVKESFDNVICM